MTRAHSFVLGALLGLLAGLLWALLTSVAERDEWRCTSYSPVTGRCVLMQHRDYVP